MKCINCLCLNCLFVCNSGCARHYYCCFFRRRWCGELLRKHESIILHSIYARISIIISIHHFGMSLVHCIMLHCIVLLLYHVVLYWHVQQIGGTQLSRQTLPVSQTGMWLTDVGEVACDARTSGVITSGGGFSWCIHTWSCNILSYCTGITLLQAGKLRQFPTILRIRRTVFLHSICTMQTDEDIQIYLQMPIIIWYVLHAAVKIDMNRLWWKEMCLSFMVHQHQLLLLQLLYVWLVIDIC